jgi:hypothetical protein
VADLAAAAGVAFPAWRSTADVREAIAGEIAELTSIRATEIGLLGQPTAGEPVR